MRQLLSSVALALTVTLVATAAGSATWEVSNASVVVVCPMTIGGSFEAKTTALSGQLQMSPESPGTLTGRLAAGLSSIDTGIGLRNRHLRENYLEVGLGEGYADAVLEDIRLEGEGVAGLAGVVSFQGRFTVHGQTRDVAGTAGLTRSGDSIRVEATFPVHIPDYAIKKPRHLGVGVKDTVTVKVSFDAVPSAE